MEWYHYLSGLWSGAFLTNFVPHFVAGASGKRFTTPFANPGGRGLSSPTTNVLWSLFNLVVGYVLFKAGKVSLSGDLSTLVFFAGIGAMALFASKALAHQVPDVPKEAKE